MLAARTTVRLLAIIAALLSVAACDDDPDKKPKYEVEIYVSDDLKWEIHEVKSERRFKKPLVEVHHPEGVDVRHVERKPRKTTVYDFAPVDLPALLAGLLTVVISCFPGVRRRYTFDVPPPQFSPPVYQRG